MVKKNMISNSSEKIINKGAWTAEEDRKLSEFVKIHGDKKWRSLPVRAGLSRCGKSCRLRWLNYLRPGIKRGNISEDEEDLIIRLHNLLGNRWALIAGRLPGRTDNEIKNHWNTHLSKKSLTINELNNKLYKKNEAGSDRSLVLSVMDGPDLPAAPLDPSNQSKASGDAQAASRPWNELTERDIFGGFFDFPPMVSDLPDSGVHANSHFGVQGHDFRRLGAYEDILSTGLPGSNGQYFDEQIIYNQLDFDTLTKLLEYENDVFFSLPQG